MKIVQPAKRGGFQTDNVTLDPSEFTKISFNVPKKLLAEFDQVATLNHYSRVEAMKEAMRRFIEDQTPENYNSPSDWEVMYKGMLDGIVSAMEDPKYKKLGIDPNAALQGSQK